MPSGAGEDRLTRPPFDAAPSSPLAPGLHGLGLSVGRDGVVFVPAAEPGAPLPLLVMLHGAGSTGAGVLTLVQAEADRRGVAVLAPDSRDPRSWDVIRGGYGPDVAFLQDALGALAGRLPLRPDRLAIGGFSDGGSYALSLGIANGDLFGDILAFSPGFAAPSEANGSPRVFISHGDADTVLPIDRCGRALAQRLDAVGYDVVYREFRGGHVVPRECVAEALARFLG